MFQEEVVLSVNIYIELYRERSYIYYENIIKQTNRKIL